MNVLAANQQIDQLIGTIAPPVDSPLFANTAGQSLGIIIARGISLVIIVAGLFMLAYMLWGAFDWVISGGEKERIAKAQNKITHAVVGFLVIFVVLAVFGIITGNVLNIVKVGPSGWEFKLPQF